MGREETKVKKMEGTDDGNKVRKGSPIGRKKDWVMGRRGREGKDREQMEEKRKGRRDGKTDD